MTAQSKWLRYFKLNFFNLGDEKDSEDRYRLLHRNMILFMILVTIVPLVLMALVNYHQYRTSLKAEIINPMRVLSSKTKHSFELFVEEKLSTVRFITSAYSIEELANKDKLNKIFRVLKKEFPGFVDLGLIDYKGIQVSYAGPYELLGKNYSDQSWYHEVIVRGVYISDVFMGYRKFPHIAIAVQLGNDVSGSCILRATIDTHQFDNLIAAMELDAESDAFLINDKGVFQTHSKFYGKVLDNCPFSPPLGNYGNYIAEEKDPNGREIISVYTHFDKMGYSLVLIKPKSVILKTWFTLKSEMFFIFIISTVLIILTIFKITSFLINKTRDADERRELAFRELEHSQKLSSIGRLAAGVAHEINNPLAIINEKAGLMKDLIELTSEFKNRDKFLGLTNSIQKSVERCKTITHRLLGFARRMEVQFEVLNVNDVVKEVLGFLEKEYVYRGIDIRLELDENLPQISSDLGQLQQVFLNILSNAIAAVADNGNVTIKTWDQDPETIGVSIKDNGTGMSEETIKHIFEPFFTTKKGYGTGLGLAITYGIIQKLGGKIKVESKLGEGSIFHVYLPKKAPLKSSE
ncbi:MAG: two-component sensor histidine kinase [Desulfobacterales bacterium CG23_combo_of_CG06-09_8_20_14_all_52_9]|nr:MAG: two-component sensor histidine kinase [Desulfobacterales bacterium CG23_combo_of_CG06-09_8_20_14_all_52_9]